MESLLISRLTSLPEVWEVVSAVPLEGEGGRMWLQVSLMIGYKVLFWVCSLRGALLGYD